MPARASRLPLLAASALALSGCLITEPGGAPSLTECEARRAGALADCVCDPLTAELVCPDGVVADLGRVDGGVVGPDMSAPPPVDMFAPPPVDAFVIDDPDMSAPVDMAQPVDVGPPGGCGGVALPPGCGCDVFTGEVICSEPMRFSCSSWVPVYALNAPADELSCLEGSTRVRFDAAQSLWVGVTRCASGLERLYLSEDGSVYLPAGDSSGHGQDHCELIQPGFQALSNDDDITSGGCRDCSTTMSVSLEGLDEVFVRSRYGERFRRESSSQGVMTSRVFCGSPACP